MRKALYALTAAGLSLLLLAGCADSGGQTPQTAYQVYYLSGADGGGTAVAPQTCYVPAEQEPVPALLDLLLREPYENGQSSPFPQGAELRDWTLEDGTLTLDFSEPYGGLSGIDLILANACLTLTLCQAEGVEAVRVTVEGETLPFQTADALRPEDLLLSGTEEEPVYYTATLWFPRTSGEGLGVEYRQMMLIEGDSLVSVVFHAWLAGPASDSLAGPELQDGFLISGVTEGEVCYLDLSEEFWPLLSGTEDQVRLRLYSLVNTMASNLEGVSAVQLRVQGESPGRCAGLDLSVPLEADPSLEKS